MKISELEAKLAKIKEEHGDISVLLEIDRTTGGAYSFDYVSVHEAEEDEYPADWGMPAGFKFVSMTVIT